MDFFINCKIVFYIPLSLTESDFVSKGFRCDFKQIDIVQLKTRKIEINMSVPSK